MDLREKFFQHYNQWYEETCFKAIIDTENEHFRAIVNMGFDAVPFIAEVLENGPSHIVLALDEIFPDLVIVKGQVDIKQVCDTWFKLIKLIL